MSTATRASWPQRTWPTSCASVKRMRTRRVRAVDPEHRALAVPPAAPGDVVGERRDGDREAQALLDELEQRPDGRLRRQAELRAKLARPLRPDVRVLPGHGAGTVALPREHAVQHAATSVAPAPAPTARRRSRPGARATRRPGRCRRRRRSRGVDALRGDALDDDVAPAGRRAGRTRAPRRSSVDPSPSGDVRRARARAAARRRGVLGDGAVVAGLGTTALECTSVPISSASRRSAARTSSVPRSGTTRVA